MSTKAYLVKGLITMHLFLEPDLRVIKYKSKYSQLLFVRPLTHFHGGMWDGGGRVEDTD